ncbi:MAG: 50S ribosomal protein L6 [Clostridia bacterium]|nr:50S ribosomal protein L6 [Clostridia bacterium]MBR2327263.1 50S ribosomal protein L6 [Clostridia bacterium]
MSRIGRMPVAIPAGVEVTLNGSKITVKGPKGTLERELMNLVSVKVEDGQVIVTRDGDEKEKRSAHGLTRTLIKNMIEGVTVGYTKNLEIVGVGYRAAKSGKDVTLTIGFSHPVIVSDTDLVKIDVPQPNQLVITGIDKQAVGECAAVVRKIRPPEPYHGKGIRYAGEVVHLKEGKAGKSSKK